MGSSTFTCILLLLLVGVVHHSPALPIAKGHPISPQSAVLPTVTPTLVLVSLVTVVVVLGAAFLGAACLCCKGRPTFKVLSRESLAVQQDGYQNAALNSGAELAIFPPMGGAGVEEDECHVTFEPLPNLRPPWQAVTNASAAALESGVGKRLLAIVPPGGRHVSAADWFDDPHKNFPRHQLQYIREIGHGWFGRAVEGRAVGVDSSTGLPTIVVVKILRPDASPTEQMRFLHEARPYRDLSHPNILHLMARCLESDPLLLVLESCPMGDLKAYLRRSDLDALESVTALVQLSSAISHMHSRSFVHTDLACRNCLVTSDGQVKVGDYGTSVEKYREDYYCCGVVAVPIRWCAPETLRVTEVTMETREVDAGANVWSFGVMAWEVTSKGEMPHGDWGDEEVIQKVLVQRPGATLQEPTAIKECCREKLYGLMKQCWQAPVQRPTMEDIVSILQTLQRDLVGTSSAAFDSQTTPQSDFEHRWNTLRPNTCPGTIQASEAAEPRFEASPSPHPSLQDDFVALPPTSLSLQNLNGSLDDLPGESKDVESLQQMDSLSSHRTHDSDLDDDWRWRVERGEFSEKVLEKSRSVQDLMVLTHIDGSDLSDSDSLGASLVFSSEGHLCVGALDKAEFLQRLARLQVKPNPFLGKSTSGETMKPATLTSPVQEKCVEVDKNLDVPKVVVNIATPILETCNEEEATTYNPFQKPRPIRLVFRDSSPVKQDEPSSPPLEEKSLDWPSMQWDNILETPKERHLSSTPESTPVAPSLEVIMGPSEDLSLECYTGIQATPDRPLKLSEPSTGGSSEAAHSEAYYTADESLNMAENNEEEVASESSQLEGPVSSVDEDDDFWKHQMTLLHRGTQKAMALVHQAMDEDEDDFWEPTAMSSTNSGEGEVNATFTLEDEEDSLGESNSFTIDYGRIPFLSPILEESECGTPNIPAKLLEKKHSEKNLENDMVLEDLEDAVNHNGYVVAPKAKGEEDILLVDTVTHVAKLIPGESEDAKAQDLEKVNGEDDSKEEGSEPEEVSYTPDFDSESEEEGDKKEEGGEEEEVEDEEDEDDGTSSSTSGEFEWREGEGAQMPGAGAAISKQECKGQPTLSYIDFPMESIAEVEEEEEEGTSSESGEEDFVPSKWKQDATPNRSSIRSPDKRLSEGVKKSVSFKQQRHHRIYEYPREPQPASPEDEVHGLPRISQQDGSSRTSWTDFATVMDYSQFADWELGEEEIPEEVLELDSGEMNGNNDSPSRASRSIPSFNIYRLSDVDAGFGEGEDSAMDEFFIRGSSRPFQFFSASEFFPGGQHRFTQGAESGDDLAEELLNSDYWHTPSSAPATNNKANLVVPANTSSLQTVGELRHTRDKLKLELPQRYNGQEGGDLAHTGSNDGTTEGSEGSKKASSQVKGEALLLDSCEELSTGDSGVGTASDASWTTIVASAEGNETVIPTNGVEKKEDSRWEEATVGLASVQS